jgi:HEPN superfamily AbiU2-like protein
VSKEGSRRTQAESSEDYFQRVARVYLKPIAREIRNLLLTRNVFWEVQGIIAKNERLHSQGLFNNWLATNYGISLAIGLRRQMDGDRTSVSLLRLLRLVVCKPELVLRERFVNSYRPEQQKYANETFDRLAGRGHQIDPSVSLADLNALEDAFRPIRRFINRSLAHSDMRAAKPQKFGELDRFLDLLKEIFAKYLLLFLAQGKNVLEPNIDPEWKSVFRTLWIS